MRKVDPVLYWLLFYLILYMIALKAVPVTAGAFSVAVIFALIIENISTVFQKLLKMKRWTSTLVASLIFFGILSYSIYSVIPIVVEQWKSVSSFVSDFMKKSPSEIFPSIKSEEMLQMIKTAMDRIGEFFVSSLGKALTFAFSKIPDLLTSTLLLIISSTYLVIVFPKLRGVVPYMFPRSTLSRTEKFIQNLYRDMKKFVGGQMFNAIVVGLVVWIGMAIFGIKYAGFLGLLSGVTDFIPFLGVIIAAIPAIFIAISQQGVWGIVKVLVVLTVANQLESWILAPKVLGDRVKLNWFVILVTMLALSEVYGVIGVLVSVPFLVILRDIWREYVVDYLKRI